MKNLEFHSTTENYDFFYQKTENDKHLCKQASIQMDLKELLSTIQVSPLMDVFDPRPLSTLNDREYFRPSKNAQFCIDLFYLVLVILLIMRNVDSPKCHCKLFRQSGVVFDW